jgi:predicted Na+-dependent transporter
MPLLAVLVSKIVQLPPQLAAGLMLVSTFPGGNVPHSYIHTKNSLSAKLYYIFLCQAAIQQVICVLLHACTTSVTVLMCIHLVHARLCRHVDSSAQSTCWAHVTLLCLLVLIP